MEKPKILSDEKLVDIWNSYHNDLERTWPHRWRNIAQAQLQKIIKRMEGK